MKFSIRVEEVENHELALFLFTSNFSSQSSADFEEEPATFSLSYGDIDFEIKLGFHRSPGELDAYTEVNFEVPFECDLSVFDVSPSPTIVPGIEKPGGSIVAVKYYGDGDESHLYSEEDLQVEAIQESESALINARIHDLIPMIAEVISRVREAVRLEIFSEAIQWDFLIESIKTSQRHNKVPEAEMDPIFDDAAHLFAAFRPKGAARLPQESNIFYLLEDEEGRSFNGEIRNTRTGRSPILFANSLDAIQERIDNRGSIQERALLAACEFLYADDFRMAVFNAVTVLELALVNSYEAEVNSGTQEGFKLEREISEYKKEAKVSHPLALLTLYAPKKVSSSRDWEPLIGRCIDAWDYRDKTAAHLTTREKERELSRTEAWEMVVSIWSLITDLESAELDL